MLCYKYAIIDHMISKKDIQNLADLARIKVSDSETESLSKEIDSILGYVSQVENISAGDVVKAAPLHNVMREDTITRAPGEYTADILSNAPAREGNLIKVKKIL